MSRTGGLVAGVLATFAVLVAAGFRATPYDNYVLLADAFRHGRVWIDWPGAYIDALRYGSHYYVIEAPLPALLLLPAVLIRGTAANQSWLAALLAGVATFAAWEIGLTLAVRPLPRAVLCGFLLLGTDLLWCAAFGDVWFIAHVSAVAFTLLALLEILRARRGWLVALFAACALESRFTLVVAVPVYAAMLVLGIGERAGSAGGPSAAAGETRFAPRAADRWRSLATYGGVLAVVALLWVGYNEARWGLPYDVGYTTWFHQDSAGQPTGAPFGLRYFTYQVQSFFVAAPERQAGYPYLVPGIGGVALTWTSPALLLAFFARRPQRLVVALWVLTGLCAAPNFLYYVNGYAQFGMRHALDFEPYLIVLMMLAARPRLRAIWVVVCAYSMLAGAWGVWYWRAFVRP